LLLKIKEKIASIASKNMRYDDIKDMNISNAKTAWAHFMAVTPEMRNMGTGTSVVKFRE
jgi:hypothetical protein